MKSADGYWTVEVIKTGPKQRWYRISHAHTVVNDRASIATVQRILGDAFNTLQAVAGDRDNGVA